MFLGVDLLKEVGQDPASNVTDDDRLPADTDYGLYNTSDSLHWHTVPPHSNTSGKKHFFSKQVFKGSKKSLPGLQDYSDLQMTLNMICFGEGLNAKRNSVGRRES